MGGLYGVCIDVTLEISRLVQRGVNLDTWRPNMAAVIGYTRQIRLTRVHASVVIITCRIHQTGIISRLQLFLNVPPCNPAAARIKPDYKYHWMATPSPNQRFARAPFSGIGGERGSKIWLSLGCFYVAEDKIRIAPCPPSTIPSQRGQLWCFVCEFSQTAT